MEVLLTATWVLIALGTCWAIVGIVQFFYAIRHDRNLSALEDAQPAKPVEPLPRPRLPERERYQRARAQRVLPGEREPAEAPDPAVHAGADRRRDA